MFAGSGARNRTFLQSGRLKNTGFRGGDTQISWPFQRRLNGPLQTSNQTWRSHVKTDGRKDGRETVKT